MKSVFFSTLLGLSLPAFAADQQTPSNQAADENALLKVEALDDIKAVIMSHERVRNPDFVQLFEQFIDCSKVDGEKPSLMCMGFYSVYHQAPAPGVEPSFGEFTISFGLSGQEPAWIIDSQLSKLEF